MSVVDDIFDFIRNVQVRTPGQIQSLEIQGLTLAGVAGLSRLFPNGSRRIINNPATRLGARYVSRHPVAALAAYSIGFGRAHLDGPGWAGNYTREIETAALTPLIGSIPAVFRRFFRTSSSVLSLQLTSEARQAAGLINTYGLPRIPTWVVNNRHTRAFARYLSRHPVAALAAYFAGNQIDRSFHPQFLGSFTQPAITAGLFPFFAHYSPFIPRVFRALGSTTLAGSRVTASAAEFFIGLFLIGTGTTTPLYQNRRYLWRNSSDVGAFVTNVLSRIPGLIRGTGHTVNYGFRGLAWTYELLASKYDIFGPISKRISEFKPFARWIANIASEKTYAFFHPLQWPTWRRLGLAVGAGGAAYAWQWYTFGVSSLRLATQGTWPYLYELPAYIPGFAEFILGGVGWGKPGIQWAYNHAAHSLHGAYSFSAEWAKPVLRPVLSGIRNAAGAISTSIATSWRGTGLLSLSELRAWGTVSKNALIWTGGFGSSFVSALRSPVAPYVSAPLTLGPVAEMAADLHDYRRELLNRIENRINWLQELQDRGIYFGPDLNLVRSGNPVGLPRQPIFTEMRRLENYLDYVTSLALFTPQQRNYDQLGDLIAISAESFGQISENVGGFLDRQLSRDWYFQRTRWGGGVLFKNGLAAQPRDALGRFIKKSFAYTTAQPGVPTGLAQAMAYVAKLRQNVIVKLSQGGTAGYRSHGASAGFTTGHKGRQWWLYRGRDRNLLLQTLRDMIEIVERDALEATGKKTTTISVRDPIFPQTAPGLTGAVKVLIRQMQYDASLVRNRGTGGGYYSIGDKTA